jgi:hypothetical protein
MSQKQKAIKSSVAWVHERPPLVGEVSANICGERVLRGSLWPYSPLAKSFSPYLNSEAFLQCSYESTNPEPEDPVHAMPPGFLKVHFTIILPEPFPMASFFQTFGQSFCRNASSHLRALHGPSNSPPRHEHKIMVKSINYETPHYVILPILLFFLPHYVQSSSPSFLFSDITSLRSSLKARVQFVHQYKRTSEITGLYFFNLIASNTGGMLVAPPT